ncbi:PVC-type heme-binding CxxCH protein [Planctomyces sp. SH-PL14]|uniref:PVC-type heme-binding CxxCH protein n=1 Tax=Planctomyces sp. SH-PL14 TaxID=1632864 RepID=UPI00078E9C86|nr:PVC-type heme-binding CxxCH protein [Planctomyces sp. SH-PL14]AMV19649.1 Cytochrome c [Planctomyces sp. SH-PL14]
MRPLIAATLGLLLSTTPLYAQRDLKDIPLPDPELERKTFVLPEGFEVNLFAADPQIAKPIQMNFDPQGRLWIVSSEVYPQIEPGQVANDKVLIVEDKNHDGVADSTSVFADGLLIPTGIAPGDGGAYVGASTELLFLKDTDGDGKADHRRVVLSGFGTEDTHHIIHTFRWGPEQLLYFSQSIYIHSHIETPWGVKRLNAGGIWQMRPENLELDIILRGLVNTWGTAWDQWGATFATDGAGGEGINYVVPGASYTTAYGAPRILRGLNPGSPKDCGLEIVSGAHLPDDWQGSLITNDFRGHRVCRYVLKEQGSGYLSQEQQEVIKSDHVAFRPIDVKQGPDGAIYIADWYNPIIQHGEVDFRDPRRDKVHGRIWRVSYKGKPAVAPTKLVGTTTEQLLEQLKSPEGFVRQQAKRVLRERASLEGKQDEIVAALRTWSQSMDNTAPGYHRARLEALWMYVGLDVVEPELLGWLLRCSDHHVRAAATRVVGQWLNRLPDALALLQKQVTDAHPQVRLEAVRVLGRVQDPRAIEIAALALDKEMDEWLDYSLWLTSRELQPVWQPALTKGEITFGNNARHLAFVLKSAGSPEAVPALVKMLQNKQVQDADRPQVLDVIGEFGRGEDLKSVFDLAIANQDPGLLASLLTAHAKRNVSPAGDLAAIAPLLKSENAALRTQAARGVGAWHVESQWEALRGLIEDKDPAVVDAAILGIADFGGKDAVALLEKLSGDAKTFRPAITGLLKHRPEEAAKAFVTYLQDGARTSGGTQDADLAALFAAFLQRKDGAGLLAAALKDQKIKADAAVIGQRAIGASGQAHEALTKALATAANIATGPRVLTPEQMTKEIEFVQAHGNAARGEAIFRRAELNCFKCHAVGDAGGQVGPNLVSLGATAQLDYVINSLLDPNKNVKEGFTTVVVVTDEGKVLSGVKLRESDTDLIIRDADDREISIPKSQIDEQKAGASIMPVGLADRLTESELADLVAFLAALGKQPDFTIKPELVVRRWLALQASEPAANAIRRTSYATAATDDPAFQFAPVYSTVGGALPLGELPTLRATYALKPGERGASYVRTEMEVVQAGKGRIVVSPAKGVAGWLNDKPFDPASDALLDLPVGKHRITLAINRDVAGDGPLNVRIQTPEQGGALVKLVGGK